MPVKKPAPGELETIETASRDEVEALQLQRLKWTLRHAYDNVAHYRASFDAAGVRPDDLRTLGDLARFPFTIKTDLRDPIEAKLDIDAIDIYGLSEIMGPGVAQECIETNGTPRQSCWSTTSRVLSGCRPP
jgi:phenylacetate-coenzyme A ligase PaaK-like adenylate-forming protein